MLFEGAVCAVGLAGSCFEFYQQLSLRVLSDVLLNGGEHIFKWTTVLLILRHFCSHLLHQKAALTLFVLGLIASLCGRYPQSNEHCRNFPPQFVISTVLTL